MEELSKSITPYFEESGTAQSLSCQRVFDDDYNKDDDIGYNGLDYDDYDPNEPLQPLIPLKYTSTLSSTNSSFNYGCFDDDYGDDIKEIDDADVDKKEKLDKDDVDSLINSDKFELFFNSFIDCELEGEVNCCQWMSSLKELTNELTEKDIYKLFKCIDCEHSGYLDSVDFITFCKKIYSTNNDNDNDNDGDIKRLQSVLINAIKDHPFYIRINVD